MGIKFAPNPFPPVTATETLESGSNSCGSTKTFLIFPLITG